VKPVVLFTEDAVAAIESFAREAYPNETGGVLLGAIGDGRPWVSRVVRIIPAHRPVPNRFVIPPSLTPTIVASQRSRDLRLGYLGDWHTHPADQPASGMDRASLIRVAADRQAGIRHPLLVVMRRQGASWHVDVLETRGRSHALCEVVLTGPVAK
jgi:proteasome lid subunit RPN8/RPN11